MKIFAVSDLHLSLIAPFDPQLPIPAVLGKPMNIFGVQWDDFFTRLTTNWQQTVSDEDAVLIPGDISWAMNLADTKYDFAYIASLPGQKIISRGNHDYWWDGIGKLRAFLPESIFALQHDAIDLGKFAVCATRGWLLPEHNDFKENADRKIYDRELLRLEFALKAAAAYQSPIIAMLHYPPLDHNKNENEVVALLKKYPVVSCVYGHLHGNKSSAFEGIYAGINFTNVSVDRINFTPAFIAE